MKKEKIDRWTKRKKKDRQEEKKSHTKKRRQTDRSKRKKDKQSNKGQTVERDYRGIIFASLYPTYPSERDTSNSYHTLKIKKYHLACYNEVANYFKLQCIIGSNTT